MQVKVALIAILCSLFSFKGISQSNDSTSFFPPKIYSELDKIEAMAFRQYQELLGSFDEASVYVRKDSSFVFRFTWLRSFDPPVVIVLKSNKIAGKLSMKIANDRMENNQIKAYTETVQAFSAIEVSKFQKLLNESNFWSLPVKGDGFVGHDGSTWIFEGKYENHCHVVKRWAPKMENEKVIRLIGEYLITMTGQRFEIY